jgi:hypothetical protein
MATSKATMTLIMLLKEIMTTILHLLFANQTTFWGIIHVMTDVVTPLFRILFLESIEAENEQVLAPCCDYQCICADSGCSIVMECWLHQKVHDNVKHADPSVPVFG